MSIEKIYQILESHDYKISTDSRKIASDCIYFALHGDNFNGNDFVLEAISKGASYAVSDDPKFRDLDRVICVKDVLYCLHELARIHVKKMNALIIGITGSNGKTTTKELLYSVFNLYAPTIATEGNLNNHIGVPLTIFRIKAHHQYAIIEMGANHIGEIKMLCDIAQPNISIITSIGKAHLEGFGDINGVIKAKTEIFEYAISHGGTCFYNMFDPNIAALIKSSGNSILLAEKNGDFIATYSALNPGIEFKIQHNGFEFYYRSRLFGIYNFQNAAIAACIAMHNDIPYEIIKSGIEDYIPNNMRSQIIDRKDYTILLDAYNANPSSMRLAIDSFMTTVSRYKCLILGEMAELGQFSQSEHQQLVDYINGLPVDIIVLIGKRYQINLDYDRLIYFDSYVDCKAWFDKQNFANYAILIKGSRSTTLEKLLT